jgi:molybdopterin-guanine dinucleotide biosynthesis protein A
MDSIAPDTIAPDDMTLGLIAGGRASRLCGLDKAWLMRSGVPQVLRWTRRFPGEHGPVLVSANRDPQRHAALGLAVVGDRHPDLGPIGGIDALAQACTTPWLLTLPVDLVGVNDCLVRTLVSKRDADGAFARDDDGVQPLVSLWRVDALRVACDAAIANGETAIHRLQATLHMAEVAFAGFRFGNLNTPEDLRAAGIDPEPST